MSEELKLALERREAASALRISLALLDRLHAEGKGPKATFVSGRRLYLEKNLILYLEQRTAAESTTTD